MVEDKKEVKKRRKSPPKFQIPTTVEQRDEIKEYVDSLGFTINQFFIEAYNFHRKVNGGNTNHNQKLKTVLQSFFNIPFDIPPRIFVSFLYMLANKYPNAKSKAFWTELYYVWDEDLTHKELYEAIKQEAKK